VNLHRRVLAESLAAAACGYGAAAAVEWAVIRSIRPTEWELAWVSDVVLAAAFGLAVYLWRSLLQTRRLLAARERAELVVRTQLSVAADIQRRLLPATLPDDDRLDCAAALTSAGLIGGDFYDFVEIAPSVWLVLVADVSGKGIPAAMALGSLRAAFRTLAREHRDPARLVTQLSAGLYEEWRGSLYVTCIVAVFDMNACTLVCTNAGHPAGIVAGLAPIQYLTRGGPPAGLFPGASFEQEMVRLHAGDVCLLVSDGVTEALDAGDPLERALVAATAPGAAASAADLCRAVMAQAMSGHGPQGVEQWEDDRTVVVMRVTPRARDAAHSDTTGGCPPRRWRRAVPGARPVSPVAARASADVA
jgi:sigma-B regulation protein RsbU (phosphoserine phosphatase)